MFHRDQAALLSIQLLMMCHVFADIDPVKHNILVSRGDSVIFTCNISKAAVTLIRWTKGRFIYAFEITTNMNFSNFTSDRLRIDNNVPSTMNISNVQHDDAGTYRCCLTDKKGTRGIEWNLTVSGEPEGSSPLRYSLYIPTAVIGFIICVITLAVCIYRKLRTRTPNQSPVQDHSVGEMTSPAPHGTNSGRNNRSSQYTETLNSIYGL